MKKIVFLIVIITFFLIGIIASRYYFTLAENNSSVLVITGGQNDTIYIPEEGYFKGPWYPGYSEAKQLTIINNSGRIAYLNKIYASSSFYKDQAVLQENDKSLNDYLDMMKISIDCEDSSKQITSMFNGSFRDFLKGILCNIPIKTGKSIKLNYLVYMDDKANVNPSGIEGKLIFKYLVSLFPGQVDGNGSNNEEELEEEEIYPYPDIGGHWAQDCILKLINLGIVKGYPDGTIRPERFITRNEAVTIIGRALKLKENPDINLFTDEIPLWARGYANTLKKENILEGYPDGAFKGNNCIQRQEAAVLVIKAFRFENDNDIEIKFSDSEGIGKWALEYVKAAVKNNIIEGYPDKTFRPRNYMTRAEFFKIICKILGENN